MDQHPQQRDLEEARILAREAAGLDANEDGEDVEDASYYDFDEELRAQEEEQAAIAQVEEAVAAELNMDAAEVHALNLNQQDDTENVEEDIADEEEEEIPDIIPPRILGLDDPRRMQITAIERQRALAIREAVANAPELEPISDYMCAQLALVEGDNLEGALERLVVLQACREEYEIKDTVEDGLYVMAKYLRLMPGGHLSFSFSHELGNFVLIFDSVNYNTLKMSEEGHMPTVLAGSYYTVAALTPDLEAVRRGTTLICECEGQDYKKGADIKSLKRIWSEVGSVYPCTFEKIKYFNAGMSMNVMTSMLRPFLPKNVQSKLEFGCQFEQRLSVLYLVPSLEASNERFLGRMKYNLQRRYHHEQTFKLS